MTTYTYAFLHPTRGLVRFEVRANSERMALKGAVAIHGKRRFMAVTS